MTREILSDRLFDRAEEKGDQRAGSRPLSISFLNKFKRSRAWPQRWEAL